MGLRVGCGVGVDGCLPLILVSVVISVTCWLWLLLLLGLGCCIARLYSGLVLVCFDLLGGLLCVLGDGM